MSYVLFQVVITRRIGDQTHTVTRRKDSCGNEETHVDVVDNDKGKIIIRGATGARFYDSLFLHRNFRKAVRLYINVFHFHPNFHPFTSIP